MQRASQIGADGQLESSARIRLLAQEFTRSSLGRALITGAAVTAASAACLDAAGSANSLAIAASMGLLGAGIVTTLSLGQAALDRHSRNAEALSFLAAGADSELPELGMWAAEPDFIRLALSYLRPSCRLVVEFGPGATTLVLAEAIKRRGLASHIVSFEHDPAYAAMLRTELQRRGTQDIVTIVKAPLKEQEFDGRKRSWYDLGKVTSAINGPVDLVLVDGPPSTSSLARWGALPAIHEFLSEESVLLMDDGRRRDERRTISAWRRSHTDFSTFWCDSFKGTWILERNLGSASRDRLPVKLLRQVLWTLHPRPAGFGRWPIRR